MKKQGLLKEHPSIIKEVAGTITATDNLDSITNLILEMALESTRASKGSILLLDKQGNLIVQAARGMNPELIHNLRVKLGEKICGKVAKEKNPLLVKNITNDKKTIKNGAGKYKTGSFICCPITIKNRLFGVINITDKTDAAQFTEDELDLIDILARQTAISLERSHLMSELRSKAVEMDERNKVLIDSDRLKAEFVARMSHEFRTPLNSITGAVYYLREKELSKENRKEFIKIVSDETNKLIGLLDGFLNFSLLEKEEPILQKKVLNLKSILQDTIMTKSVRDILSNNNISIKVKCPKSLSDIVGEKIRLIQSFIHLLEGVTKYTSSGDLIELKAANKENTVEIKLFVKKRSIPESELPLIFDERSAWSGIDSIKNKLRFYLAKKTIELHRGTVSISNTPEGLKALIKFPRKLKDYHEAKINELANLFLSFTAESMHLNKCSLMLFDESTGELVIRGAIGFDDDIIKNTRLRSGDKIAGLVAEENRPLLIEDIENNPQILKKSSSEYNTKSLLSLPITIKNKVVGVLNLNNKTNGKPFNKKDLYFAGVIAERIAHLIEKVKKGELKDDKFKDTVKSLEALITAKRHYKKENGKLSNLVLGITQHMECSEDEIKLSLYASALYDLGLTQIDESITLKDRKLSAMEQKIIKTHSISGAGLIDSIEKDRTVNRTILHHHERYDGSGYPGGLKGEDIPVISRVLAVVDTYTALLSDRPYRKAVSRKKAIEQIIAGSGRQFDPKVVDAFTKTVKSTH
jgi:HD-GYP domain-containing protein (c-di-GMP phosphodiesterase class II)/signal transduction histidine kinase